MPEKSIHGVVGENGAGKSTLMKILYGLYSPDEGEIWIRGRKRRIGSPHQAIELGIGMVHQHFMLIPTLTVWQNIILGHEPANILHRKQILEELGGLQKSFGLSLDLESRIEELALGQQQQVEILKLLYRRADVLILDEPTAVLTPREVEILFEKLRSLWEKGHTICLITHKLREILKFTESVTILRDGKVVDSLPTSLLNEAMLAEKIVGRPVRNLPCIPKHARNETVLTIENLRVAKRRGRPALDRISLEVGSHEIVGIAGVEGNGQQELVEVLSRVQPQYEGLVTLMGSDVRENPTYFLKQEGLAVIPSDRHRDGLILAFSLRENLILGHHREARFTRGKFISLSKTVKESERLVERFDIRPQYLENHIVNFSGGNQQKAIAARELSTKVRFLVASHPTRGLDIGAIETIHALILSLREEGAAILLISSELDEILALADRILVLYEGRIVGETMREAATPALLGLWMTGGNT